MRVGLKMAVKKGKTGQSVMQILKRNSLKIILGVVATSSFAIAFGQERIQQVDFIAISLQLGLSGSVLPRYSAVSGQKPD